MEIQNFIKSTILVAGLSLNTVNATENVGNQICKTLTYKDCFNDKCEEKTINITNGNGKGKIKVENTDNEDNEDNENNNKIIYTVDFNKNNVDNKKTVIIGVPNTNNVYEIRYSIDAEGNCKIN